MCGVFTRRTPVARRSHAARRGVSIVLMATLLTVLIAFVSLAVDFGRIRLVRAQLQTAADASARAGAFGQTRSTQSAIDEALLVAVKNEVLDNDRQGNSRVNPGVELLPAQDVVFGIWHASPAGGEPYFEELVDRPGTDQDERRAANAIRTHARRLQSRDNPVKLIFAPVVGVFTNDIERLATAWITAGKKEYGFVGLDWVKSNGQYANITNQSGTPYGGGVASNGDIDLGNADVTGDARAGGELIQKNNSVVTGWTATLDYPLEYDADLYNPPIPFTTSGISSPPLVGNKIDTNSSATINAGTYRFSSWNQGGSGTVIVKGFSTIYIDGDMDIGGSTRLVIDAADGPVRFFINGNFTQIGGNIINTGPASNLEISMTGANTTFNYKGTAATAAHIYAPASDVVINGTPGFTGWIIGKTLEFKGVSTLYYDESRVDNTPYKIRLVQ